MLLLCLAITPARKIFGLNELISVRRMIGVTGLVYALAHVAMYFGLDNYDLSRVAVEVRGQSTLWIATAATLALLALGVTSFDGAIRAMGTKAWNHLHDLVYPAVGLGLLHFDMSPGAVGGLPFVMAGLFLWLIGWRVLDRVDRGARPMWLVVLALSAAVSTFGFEAGWLALYQAIAVTLTATFTFSLVSGLPETWQVLVAGLAVAALAAVFGVRTPTRLFLHAHTHSALASRPP